MTTQKGNASGVSAPKGVEKEHIHHYNTATMRENQPVYEKGDDLL